jgi:seryl-tRNA synthetase
MWPWKILRAISDLQSKVAYLLQWKERFQMTQAELAQELANLKAQAVKSKAEILAKVAALEAAINNAPVTADVTTALGELKTAVGEIDELNPDAA